MRRDRQGNRMRYWRYLGLLGLLLWSAGQAAGTVLMQEQLRLKLTEPLQITVVEVNANKTATVHMFMALSDTTGKANDMYYFLPLQNQPPDLRVTETKLETFFQNQIMPLDAVYRAGWQEVDDAKKAAYHSFDTGALLAGPVAFWVGDRLWLENERGKNSLPKRGPEAGIIMADNDLPLLPLSANVTRAQIQQVYAALVPEELPRLVQLPPFPLYMQNMLEHYRGRPFALLKLRTMPYGQLRQTWWTGTYNWQAMKNSNIRPVSPPGLMVKFTQTLAPRGDGFVYDLPLATSRGWDFGIPEQRIFISAPKDLPVRVQYPKQLVMATRFEQPQNIIPRDELIFTDKTRQVHIQTYRAMKADEDVQIQVAAQGSSKFAAQQRNQRWAVVGLPLWGIAAWLGMMWLVTRRDDYVKRNDYWRATALGWVILQVVLLPVTIVMEVIMKPRGGLKPVPMLMYAAPHPQSGQGYGFIAVALLVPIVIVAGIIWLSRLLAVRQMRSLLRKSFAAGLLSAALYVPVGYAVQGLLESLT
jgi:hypothetical protein